MPDDSANVPQHYQQQYPWLSAIISRDTTLLTRSLAIALAILAESLRVASAMSILVAGDERYRDNWPFRLMGAQSLLCMDWCPEEGTGDTD